MGLTKMLLIALLDELGYFIRGMNQCPPCGCGVLRIRVRILRYLKLNGGGIGNGGSTGSSVSRMGVVVTRLSHWRPEELLQQGCRP
jgi:hypothetical protein